MNFNVLIRKINKNGTGFAKFPINFFESFRKGDYVTVTIKKNPGNMPFYAKVIAYGSSIGVYVPKKLMNQNSLPKKKEVTLEKSRGLPLKVGSDGRIYFPNELGKRLSLAKEDILELKILFNGCLKKLYCKLNMRTKPNTIEYFVFLPKEFYNGSCILKETNKLEKNKLKSAYALDFNKILRDFTFAEIENKKIILFLGHRVPVIINAEISLTEIAHYLGCYFADGTKRGNSWAICASTFEQAQYFLNLHRKLIHQSLINFQLTYTDPAQRDSLILKEKLSEIWRKNIQIQIPTKSIFIYNTKCTDAANRNTYGSLTIREYRQIVLVYYNRLLLELLHEIITKRNKPAALDFICGVLEGDGCASAKSHGHVIITTNDKETSTLNNLFNLLDFKHNGYREKRNKNILRIGSLELIERIEYLGPRLFKYYPKRRGRTINRLLSTGAAKFLTGKQPSTAYWILKRFKEKGILTENNGLTSKGKAIQKALLDLEQKSTTLKLH